MGMSRQTVTKGEGIDGSPLNDTKTSLNASFITYITFF